MGGNYGRSVEWVAMRMENKKAGRELRKIREFQGLTLREVYHLSKRVAARKHSRGFIVPASRLSEIESSGAIPSIHRLYTLAQVYKLSLSALLTLYGVNDM